jgi:hypothetical protein
MVQSGGSLLMPAPLLQPAPTALHRAQAAVTAASASSAGSTAAVEGGGAAGGHGVSFIEDDGLVDQPVEAIAGVLDIEEQRQLSECLTSCRAVVPDCLPHVC